MLSALLSASGWVINPHYSLRTKLTVPHQDAIPASAPTSEEMLYSLMKKEPEFQILGRTSLRVDLASVDLGDQ